MANSRTSRAVPVAVKVVSSAPSIQPTTAPVPAPAPTKKTLPKLPRLTPLSATPEHVRQRMLWPIVAGIAVLLLGSWVTLFRQEIFARSGPGVSSLWHSITKSFSGLNFGRHTTTAAEKEIRQLDSQVFPELSNT